MLQTIKKSSLLLPPFIPKGEDHANDILCGWGIVIIYGDLPFTVHVCTGLSTLPGEEERLENVFLGFDAVLSEKVKYCRSVCKIEQMRFPDIDRIKAIRWEKGCWVGGGFNWKCLAGCRERGNSDKVINV